MSLHTSGDKGGLETLSKMLETEPRFFKKHFKEMTEVLTKIFRMPNSEAKVRRMAT